MLLPLKANHLYQILARNATKGIWIPKEQGFLIAREKYMMNYQYLDIELHNKNKLYSVNIQTNQDPIINTNFGTACEIELIETIPYHLHHLLTNMHMNMDSQELLQYLLNAERGDYDSVK